MSYSQLFLERINADPTTYQTNATQPVMDDIPSEPELDSLIKEYEQIIDDESDASDMVQKDKWVNGIALISVRYHPERTRYQLISNILWKLQKCVGEYPGVCSGINITQERINAIYDAMISDVKIQDVLELFTLQELRVYGW